MYDSRFTNIPKEDRRSSFATALRLIRDVQQKSDAKDKREVQILGIGKGGSADLGQCRFGAVQIMFCSGN